MIGDTENSANIESRGTDSNSPVEGMKTSSR